MSQIFCFMAGGANLTDEMRTLLFRTARSMYQEKRGEARVVTDDLVGVLETRFETTGFGHIYGIFFHAELDTVYGKATVDYIVQTRDMEGFDPEDFSWTRLVMFPSDPRAQNAQWN